MKKRRILLGSLLAIATALPIATPTRADARVFIGVGFGFPAFGFGFPYYAPYYYPPYYAPPAYYYPPPLGYVPPPAADWGPTPPIGPRGERPPAPRPTGPDANPGSRGPSAIARCVTGTAVCPLHYVEPVGTTCSCPDNAGGHITGRAG